MAPPRPFRGSVIPQGRAAVVCPLAPRSARLLAWALARARDEAGRRGHDWPGELDELQRLAQAVSRGQEPSGAASEVDGSGNTADAGGDEHDLLTIPEAARALHVSVSTIKRMRDNGELADIRIRRRVFIRRTQIGRIFER